MKRAKSQNYSTKSLKTSTPVSENVVSNFLPSLKQMSVVKPLNRKKKSMISNHDFFGVKKRRKAKGSNLSYSFFQGCNDFESFKENLTAQTNSVSNALEKNRSRRSKTALKPINAFEKVDRISDEPSMYQELLCNRRYRSSYQNSVFDYMNYDTDAISFNKTKIQKSGNLANCNKAASPFLSARNRQEVIGARKKEINASINADAIVEDGFISRKKSLTLHKRKKPVESDTLSEITHGAMRTLSNSSISKKVRFSDKIEVCGGSIFPRHIFNSEKTSVKEDKAVSDPYGVKELLRELEFLEVNLTSMNKKRPMISKTQPQQMKKTIMKDGRKTEESEKCSKKEFLKDGSKSNSDERLQVERTKLRDGGVNFPKENKKGDAKAKKKKKIQLSVAGKESLDCNMSYVFMSTSLKLRNNSKLSSNTENKVINMELDDEEVHLGNEEFLYINILNWSKDSQKNGAICTLNNKKYEKELKLDNESNISMSQTKGSANEKNRKLFLTESKQREGEIVVKYLGSSEETILYPSTSTPFGSPQSENNKSSLNFQSLSPILEHQSSTANDILYYYEPSVVCTERTYSKCKLRSISKEEKLWSLITTTSSADIITETLSATPSVERPEEHEENDQQILLFETPPQKILSDVTFKPKRQDKEKDKKLKKKFPFHKRTKLETGKRIESNKALIRKGENSSELNNRETEQSNHFEDVLEWNLCIEKKESKTKFFVKGDE